MSGGLIARGADGRARPLRVGAVIHKGGGAGRICAVKGDPGSVVKLYHDPAGAIHYKPKIEAMLARPPDLPAIEEGGRRYVQIAWPTAVVEEASGRFLGFTMPFIDLRRADSLDTLLVKALRRHRGLPENYAYRLFAAQNVASLVAELHRRGHYVIDLKPQNLSVYKDSMYVAAVDCDGLSIDGGGTLRFPGHQFTDGYRCPEGAKSNLDPESLGEAQDRFALAVVLFQLLNNGVHPFQGVPLNKGGSLGTEQERINAGLYAYGARANAVQGPASASIHEYFEDSTRELCRRAFETRYRPAAHEWRDHLRDLIERPVLERCASNPAEHAHFSKGCGLCALDDKIRRRAQAAGKRRRRARYRAPPGRRSTTVIFGRRKPTARPPVQKTRPPWAGLSPGKWLWGTAKRWLMGTPRRTPPLKPAEWGALFFAYLIYGLFAANLSAIVLVVVSGFEPNAFHWLADFMETNGLLPDFGPTSGRDGLVAMRSAIIFYVAVSIFVGLCLAFANRGRAAGTLVESHGTWIVRTFWLAPPVALAAVAVAYATWPIGFAAVPGLFLWFVYRCAKGLVLLHRRRHIPAPRALI